MVEWCHSQEVSVENQLVRVRTAPKRDVPFICIGISLQYRRYGLEHDSRNSRPRVLVRV